MKAVLLIDFGSTYTKITAVDLDTCNLLGTRQVIQPWKVILTMDLPMH